MGGTAFAGVSVLQYSTAVFVARRIVLSIASNSEPSSAFQLFLLFLFFPSSSSRTALPRSPSARSVDITGLAVFEITAEFDEWIDAVARTTSELGWSTNRYSSPSSDTSDDDDGSRSDADNDETDRNVRSPQILSESFFLRIARSDESSRGWRRRVSASGTGEITVSLFAFHEFDEHALFERAFDFLTPSTDISLPFFLPSDYSFAVLSSSAIPASPAIASSPSSRFFTVPHDPTGPISSSWTVRDFPDRGSRNDHSGEYDHFR